MADFDWVGERPDPPVAETIALQRLEYRRYHSRIRRYLFIIVITLGLLLCIVFIDPPLTVIGFNPLYAIPLSHPFVTGWAEGGLVWEGSVLVSPVPSPNRVLALLVAGIAVAFLLEFVINLLGVQRVSIQKDVSATEDPGTLEKWAGKNERDLDNLRSLADAMRFDSIASLILGALAFYLSLLIRGYGLLVSEFPPVYQLVGFYLFIITLVVSGIIFSLYENTILSFQYYRSDEPKNAGSVGASSLATPYILFSGRFGIISFLILCLTLAFILLSGLPSHLYSSLAA